MEEKLKNMLGFKSQIFKTFMLVGLAVLLIQPNAIASGGDKENLPEPRSVFSASNEAERMDYSQQDGLQVTGAVTDPQGETLPGVNIVEKGTGKGVVTNMDGEYLIEVDEEDAVLVFSFIGFATKEVQVNGRTEINVELQEETKGLEEVVVTAMGVRSEKRRLNFAVQSVDSEEILKEKESNFVDALQGKISGLEVSSTGGSPTASSQMLIRGISSINPAQNNEPIFILNGMHVSGGASQAAELNPNDIENITVLKGAAAAALYGQEAANGAVIVTTKSGEAGELQVQYSSTLKVDQATRLPEIQDKYLRGGRGVYREEALGGWGPPLPEGTRTYDNAGNFLQDGFYQKHDVSVSGGTEKFTSYASVTYTDHEGIVPENYLNRWGMLFKSDYNVTDDLKLTFMADMVQRESRGPGSPISRAYQWPIDDDMSNYQNPDGSIRWLYVDSNNRYHSPTNPYWWRYKDFGESESHRTLLQGTAVWEPLDGFELTGRMGYDLTNSESQGYNTPRWELAPGQEPTSEDYAHLGSFSYSDGKSSVMNASLMGRYEVGLSPDFNLELLGGADLKKEKGRSASMLGRNFIVPEFYSMTNVEDIRKENINMGRREKNMYGFYGEVKFDYRNLAHVGFTGRNDHSSTLPEEERSYFYPSVSGGVIFSELFGLTSNLLNYGKIRGNWAKVGKDAPLYRLNKWFTQKSSFPDGGYGVDPTRSSNPLLEPEFTTSWEVGIDTRLFDDNTRLDVAYYSTSVENQIVQVRVSPASGNILQTRNEGTITNQGIEFSWNQSILDLGMFSWNMTTNFGRNVGRVDDLPDELVEVYHYAGQVGDIRPTAYLDGSTMALSGKDYEKTDDGRVIVDEDGYPKINASSSLLIGDRQPDFTMGWQNQMNYGNWSLSTMVNVRQGGDVVNGTLRSLMSGGQAQTLEDYRNRLVMIDGVVEQEDGSYAENTNPVVYDQLFHNNYVAPVGSNFVEDGSFIRLGYVTLGYDLSDLVKTTGINNLEVSVTGRNLYLWTKYSGSDPNVNYTGTSGGTGTFGIDYLNVPNTRAFSFNVSANF